MAQPYGFPSEVATILARLTCHNNHLPQGAPSSPIISNMICWKLDGDLQRLAAKHKATYTRYADDITFSTSEASFPQQLASNESRSATCVVGKDLFEIIDRNGIKVNARKVRLQWSRSRQEVTGLVVNAKVNVPRSFIGQLRAMINNWEVNGLQAAQDKYQANYTKQRHSSKGPPDFQHIVRGKLSYLAMVRGKTDQLYLRYKHKFDILYGRSTSAVTTL